MKKNPNNERLGATIASRISYLIGKAETHAKYPVACVIATSTFRFDIVCRVARILGMQVQKHKGVWFEQDRRIEDILALEYQKKNRS